MSVIIPENLEEDTLKVSPMMAQWHACKKLAKDAVLLFRMGDFYEAFYDDAALLSKELDLSLTKRQGIPMAGVPFHACDGYLDRLVAKGYRVAIAEQTEDPKKAKGLVKREVVRVVTPGTVVSSGLLSEKTNNFFASIGQVGSTYGLALLDLTTAEFRVIEFEQLSDLQNECYRFRPAEFLVSEKFKVRHAEFFQDLGLSYRFLTSPIEDWHFDYQLCYNFLLDHFKVRSLDGYGLKGMTAAVNTAGALLQYLQDNLCLSTAHINHLQTYSNALFMSLDQNTQRNLELTESQHSGNRQNTLLSILDHSVTPMGARMMHRWVKQPLLASQDIRDRQDAVEELLNSPLTLTTLRGYLEKVRDLERLIIKVSSGYASPRDLVALKDSLEPVPAIKQCLEGMKSPLLYGETHQLTPLPELTKLIGTALSDSPPLRISDGNVFREGFNAELDELRSLSRDGKSWLARYQTELRETTGIRTAKVGYNRMFGYYIEVSKGQTDNVPASFQRRQTLVNGERYITPELKTYETKVLTAEERTSTLEGDLFLALRDEVAKYAEQVSKLARNISVLDSLQGLAEAARCHGYVRPLVDESETLIIKGGRHPVIEGALLGEKFIPNDTELDNQFQRLHLITGPNMAGKSTYIRQVALITIMAQIGSFVPAQSAHIGIVDKVFTRIGASDDLSRGQSTFMVEMTETANILNSATSRSLVILDEIGRGTSTYDGISIAWAVAEHLLTTPNKMAKTLFATHYWELTQLEGLIPGAVNYNVAVREHEDSIVFLRKIVKGGTDKSYGIHVGSLAGLPQPVIQRAREILQHLEDNSQRHSPFQQNDTRKPTKPKRFGAEVQYLLFDVLTPKKDTDETSDNEKTHAVLEQIRSLNVNLLTPVEALTQLAKLQALLLKE
ncbi:MAG: DNA mismatch repair protein MutS [Chlamydiales bacterium]|nr:DNA mismatch repair protein MutS [Chlamydiales bacterium]